MDKLRLTGGGYYENSVSSSEKSINVLSLCDGMSCGHIALDKVGITVNKYFASEIKEPAIRVTKYNYPLTIHIGDVHKVSYADGILYTENGEFKTKIDLVIFGSPCQSFSRAMNKHRRIGLSDPERSGLFYECYRILKEVNPRFFLVENVIMDSVNKDIISEMLGANPIRINSSLVSAQMRDRLYWTNIPNIEIPCDKKIYLKDIINNGYVPIDKARCLRKNDSHGFYNGCNYTPIKRFHRYWYKSFETIVFPSKEYFENCVKITEKILKGRKSRAEYYNEYIGNDFDQMRYLWKEERARLQNVPEKYVECLTEQEAADVLGDGWTIDVVVCIFSGLLTVFK